MPLRGLHEVADRTWEIAPSERVISPAAFYLPNQIERITDWTFSPEHPRLISEGGLERIHRATRGFLLKDAYLIDGVLYKADACSHLYPRARRLPQLRVDREIERGAVYCTFPGNRYFGQWMIDDCGTYPLALAEGIPVTTAQPLPVHTQGLEGHTAGYENWLEMRPTRLQSAFFRELVIFDDIGQNRSKRERFKGMEQKLLAHVDAKPHPGVFILRGKTGERRILQNELELAEHLRERRGLRILDITKSDVPTIVRTCAGARLVVGVEGSHLIHGFLFLPPGGAVLTVQPPKRYCSIFKDLTDRDGQYFGFVVASAVGKDLRVDLTEVDRTLDLFPTNHH